MRVRTGRFDGLRLADKSGNPQLVEDAVRQRDVEPFGGAVPPSAGIGSRLSGVMVRHSASHHFAVDDRTTLPVLELYCPQTVANPTLKIGEHARCLCEPEVSLPARQVPSERFAYLREASSGAAPGQFSHALLHTHDGLCGYAPPNRPSRGCPEREAEELRCRGARHLALGLVDAELQLPKQLAQRGHDPLARTLRPNVNVQIVSVADEGMPAPLQLLVDFVQQHVGQQRREWA